jgi:hypothetical protein
MNTDKEPKKGVNRGNAGKGRPKGAPNKATTDVRKAIALFAEDNAESFAEWIKTVAYGDGDQVKPDPGKAADLYLKAIEYHIPKLGRVEHTGKNGGPVVIAASPVDERL